MIFYFDSLIGDWLFCPCSGQLQPGPSGGGAEREGGVAEHPGEGDGPAEQPPVRQVHDVCQACLISDHCLLSDWNSPSGTTLNTAG